MSFLKTRMPPVAEAIIVTADRDEDNCKWHECSNALDASYQGPYPEFCSDACWMDWMSEHPF